MVIMLRVAKRRLNTLTQATGNPDDVVRQKDSMRSTWRKGRMEWCGRTISLFNFVFFRCLARGCGKPGVQQKSFDVGFSLNLCGDFFLFGEHFENRLKIVSWGLPEAGKHLGVLKTIYLQLYFWSEVIWCFFYFEMFCSFIGAAVARSKMAKSRHPCKEDQRRVAWPEHARDLRVHIRSVEA